jgi:hypothetical protein
MKSDASFGTGGLSHNPEQLRREEAALQCKHITALRNSDWSRASLEQLDV